MHRNLYIYIHTKIICYNKKFSIFVYIHIYMNHGGQRQVVGQRIYIRHKFVICRVIGLETTSYMYIYIYIYTYNTSSDFFYIYRCSKIQHICIYMHCFLRYICIHIYIYIYILNIYMFCMYYLYTDFVCNIYIYVLVSYN